MTTPIERMIDDAVRCGKCGAKMGACDCWINWRALTKGEQKKLAQSMAFALTDYIDWMYPEMWGGVPKSARTSLRNCIMSHAMSLLKDLGTRESP